MAEKGQDRTGALVERFFWMLVILTLAAGLAVRLPGLASRSLWIDELYSEWFAARSFANLWRDVPYYEPHPPIYYTLLKLWTLEFGNSELGLRSLSLVASLATILVVAVTGKLINAGPAATAAGILGAALLAVNFANIRDAQNARPYALQTFVCTVAVAAALLLVSRLERPTETARLPQGWLAPALMLGIFTGLALWFHNTSLFVAFGVWSGLALSLVAIPAGQRPGSALVYLAAGLLALLIWAPYVPIFIDQSRLFMGLAFWLQPKIRDLYSAWMLLLGASWPAFGFGLALLALGLHRITRSRPTLAILIASILFIPLYALLAVSFAVKPIYIQRLFAWMVPLGLGVIALGIVTATQLLWPRLAIAFAAAALASGSLVSDIGRPIDDWKAIVAEIARDARPGDVVIALPAEGSIAVDYYARREPYFPPIVCIPGCYPQRNLDRPYVVNLGAPAIVPSDRDIVDRALKAYRRIWLVQVSVALYDPKSIVRSRIAANRTFVRYYGNSLARADLFE